MKAHCRPDWSERERDLTCVNCAHPLPDNRLVNRAYQCNTTAGWAKHQLRILSEMADDRGLPVWFVNEVRRIHNNIALISGSDGNVLPVPEQNEHEQAGCRIVGKWETGRKTA